MGASRTGLVRAVATTAAIGVVVGAGARASERSEDAAIVAARAAWTARVELSRRDYERFAHHAIEGRAALARMVFPRLAPATGRIGDFLADGTLRPGDIVVTDKGFLVFTGGPGAISEESFVPVMTVHRAPRERETLRDLERASGFPGE